VKVSATSEAKQPLGNKTVRWALDSGSGEKATATHHRILGQGRSLSMPTRPEKPWKRET
jgi:hypothetical protein